MIRPRKAKPTLVTVVAALLLSVAAPAQPAAAAEGIVGAGSTWSEIAIQQWVRDVRSQGVSVNYQGGGSSVGRQFYIQQQVDFAVSEIPFQPASYNREGGLLYDERAQASARPYSYLPIVAGGTSFMYNLSVGGNRVTDLRLTGATIAKIFTGQITNWNDPAVTKDDGREFPSTPITPVLRSDGSGTSAQFTAYMADMYPDIWNPFCSQALNLPAPCPATSLYPYFGTSKNQSGSDGVANYVAAGQSNGAITYVEYGYAKARGFPVVSVFNAAGYAAQPTAGPVAIALTRAQINDDYTQRLGDVYRNPDPRVYPVSSYSYMIVPTSTAAGFNESKGETLGRFISYFLCSGQRKADTLGYSPLPPNLVGFGFEAMSRIPGAPPAPQASDCANPTITGEFNLNAVPAPSADTKAGAARPGVAGGGGAGQRSGGSGAVTQSDLDAATETTLSPTDESVVALDVEGETRAARSAADVDDLPISVSKAQDDVPIGVYIAVVILVLAVAFAPPTLSMLLRKRDGG